MLGGGYQIRRIMDSAQMCGLKMKTSFFTGGLVAKIYAFNVTNYLSV